jgi:hypothetical protein
MDLVGSFEDLVDLGVALCAISGHSRTDEPCVISLSVGDQPQGAKYGRQEEATESMSSDLLASGSKDRGRRLCGEDLSSTSRALNWPYLRVLQ